MAVGVGVTVGVALDVVVSVGAGVGLAVGVNVGWGESVGDAAAARGGSPTGFAVEQPTSNSPIARIASPRNTRAPRKITSG